MVKKEKDERQKHYFTLKGEINDNFLKHIEDNLLNKQKLIENLIIQYLNKNKKRK